MPTAWKLLLPALGALLAAPNEARAVGAQNLVRVWQCRFDNDSGDKPWDVNYDEWPDRWSRVYDDTHPRYARITIAPMRDGPAPGSRLLIAPDGASATAVSPPIRILPKFSYKLRLKARLKDGAHGEARVRVAFHAGSEVRQLEQTDPLENDGEWHEIELGDYQPHDSDVDRVYVEIDYQKGERGDLNAEVSIADLNLFRLPSIRIHTDSLYNVYTDPKQVRVTCSLSGISKQNPEVRFQLFDATEKAIGNNGVLELDGKIINESRTLASEIVDGFNTDKPSYEGSIDWRPPIRGYGFYRVRVGMYNPDTNRPIGEARAISMAIVPEDLPVSDHGEFGWSLPRADRPLPFGVLKELLPRVGVRMVKLPVWFHPGDDERADEIVRFAEQLAARGIETVGVLEDPTRRIADPLTRLPAPDIESLLSNEPSYWTPLIDHVITRLSLRIRWWQLGNDGDTSFVGYTKLVDRIMGIRNQMFRFGQDIRLGLGWRWDHAKRWAKPPSWDFLQMTGREQTNAAGLDSALTKAPPSVSKRWVVVAPPDVELQAPAHVDRRDLESPEMRAALIRRHQHRVRDFVEQILVAKIHGADGIFIRDPFSGSSGPVDGKTGVMNEDGTPGELFLPWRTCASLLGGAEYIGSIQMPYGSENWIFKRPDGEVVMVLWNLDAKTSGESEIPIDEVLYLGQKIELIDVWGDAEPPEQRGSRHVIPVGRMPIFVTGLNEAVARWRMAVRFDETALPSTFGAPHPNSLRLVNTFRQGVGGDFEVFVPKRDAQDPPLAIEPAREWEVTIEDGRFTLPAGKPLRVPFSIGLREAGYGSQQVRLDFQVKASESYRFSAWRTLNVGLEGLSLEVLSFIDKDGRLVIEQRMASSHGQPANFKCLLSAGGGRRRKRALVYQLGAEVDLQRYTYLNPDELIGREVRLRIEEVEGPRVLIHRFVVTPMSLEEVAAAASQLAGG